MKDGVLAKPLNVSETVYRALQTKLCTYHELNTCIGLEGAMRIIEIEQVATYNEQKIKFLASQDKR
nr:MAG TPA: hypothetical protein [Caudoviricetes sp.]